MADEFKVHRLNDEGMAKAETIARGFTMLLDGLTRLGVDGRARALVITKLQEACFFSKRCIAEQAENQEGYDVADLTNCGTCGGVDCFGCEET